MQQPPRRRRHSPRVYRRRRALVLLVLLIVVIVVWVNIANAIGGSNKPVNSGTPTSTSSVTPAATSSGVSTSIPTASTAAAPCDPKKILVTPIVDSNSFEAGQLPTFQIGITNNSKEACTYNVGTSQMSMTVTSGNETYWKSADCQAESSDTPAVLLPGKMEVSAPLQWSREYSSPDTCSTAREAVPAGGASYYLNAQVGSAKSAKGYQFLLY